MLHASNSISESEAIVLIILYYFVGGTFEIPRTTRTSQSSSKLIQTTPDANYTNKMETTL